MPASFPAIVRNSHCQGSILDNETTTAALTQANYKRSFVCNQNWTGKRQTNGDNSKQICGRRQGLLSSAGNISVMEKNPEFQFSIVKIGAFIFFVCSGKGLAVSIKSL